MLSLVLSSSDVDGMNRPLTIGFERRALGFQ
ncbi:hypothetical protein sync_0777 [Synechococcus sp. CC9311]|nr:hypothetical protein sync_0777 [Synechococcus sp. CC9311]